MIFLSFFLSFSLCSRKRLVVTEGGETGKGGREWIECSGSVEGGDGEAVAKVGGLELGAEGELGEV